MGYIEGLLSGFTDRRNTVHAEQLRKAELDHAQESAIFETLLSSPDPEIRSMALTGMMDAAAGGPGRKKGLRGFMGEVEHSPHLEGVRQLLGTPVTETRQVPRGKPTLPSTQRQGLITATSARPAAQAETSPTEGQPLAQTQPITGPPPAETFQAPPLGEGAPVNGTALGAPPRFQASVTQPVQPTPPPRPVGQDRVSVAGEATTIASPSQQAVDTVTTQRPRDVVASPDPIEREFQALRRIYGDQNAQILIAQRYQRYNPYSRSGSSSLQEGPVGPYADSPTGYGQPLYDPATGEIKQWLPAANPKAGASAPNVGGFEDYVLRRFGPDPTPANIEQARKDYAISGSASGAAAGEDPVALAQMAAASPAVLQNLTPTLTGAVMNVIAGDPTLRVQYEETRMQPIRAQAQQVLTAMNDLLRVDAEGNPLGLTAGAQGLYGVGSGRLARFIPGTETATAKAALDQITGQLTLSLIQTMKEQSRTGATGFGQLSIRELEVLEAAATMLKGEISEGRAQQELSTLREKFNKILQPATPGTAPVAAPSSAPGFVPGQSFAPGALEQPLRSPTTGMKWQIDADGNTRQVPAAPPR